MNAAARQLRPLLQVALPVAVAVALVCLAVLNMALVKTWPGEPEDGVLWQSSGPGTPVVAAAVAVGSVAHRAGIHEKDQLLTLNGNEVQSPKDVEKALHSSTVGQKITYVVTRNTAEVPITIELEEILCRVQTVDRPARDRGERYRSFRRFLQRRFERLAFPSLATGICATRRRFHPLALIIPPASAPPGRRTPPL